MTSLKSLAELATKVVARPYDDEAGFKSNWQHHFDPAFSPAELAYQGGLLADRLAFLFLSGYQSAVRHTFALDDNAWTVLAVSEDQSTDNPKPGLTEQDGHLSGFKTWVAASRTTDHLIVSTGAPPDLQFYKVDANQSGLNLVHKEHVRFLGDMSQGIAEFSQVPVAALTRWQGTDLKLFSKREPLYLYFAICGWFQQHQIPVEESMLNHLLTLENSDFTDPDHKQAFADLDESIQSLFQKTPERLFKGDYETDKAVVSLYSKVIQKRAGRL